MASWTASTAPADNRVSAGDMLSMRMGITKIWKGDIVVKKTDGYVYSAYATGATGDQFVGIASETRDNRYIVEGDSASGAAANGDRQIRIWLEGTFDFDIASSTIETDLGLVVYATEGSGTDTPRKVTTSAPAHPVPVGNIVKLIGTQTASTRCRVRITPFSTVAA